MGGAIPMCGGACPQSQHLCAKPVLNPAPSISHTNTLSHTPQWKEVIAGIVLLVGGKLAVMAAIGPMFGLTKLSALRAGLLLAPGEKYESNQHRQESMALEEVHF